MKNHGILGKIKESQAFSLSVHTLYTMKNIFVIEQFRIINDTNVCSELDLKKLI